MKLYEAVIYGVIQGLSEFLPVSSSGHLALLPYVLKLQDPGVVFDLMMHLGTALAVFMYFRKEILGYAKTFTPGLVDFTQGNPDQWFVRNFVFSTFVSVFFIFLLIPISKFARDPIYIIINLTVFGGLLWLADVISRKRIHLDAPMETGMQWRLAGLIGLAQSIAIFPGVSRSGITLTLALLLGMKRKEAGAFSFLLSLPIILAGILKEVPDLMKEQDDSGLLILLTGVGTSFVVGWLTIHYFMKLIGRIHLSAFAVYRWILAALMLYGLKG